MQIEEQTAWQVWQSVPNLDEERKKKAATILSDYRAQQTAINAPLWPTQEKIKQNRNKRVQEVFQNPLILDTDNGAFVEANKVKPGLGDNLRAREANILWLTDRYNADEADVRKRYDFYKADASQKWGSGTLDDPTLFNKAKAEIDADMVRMDKRKQATLTGIESALSGASMASELGRFLEAYPNATDDERLTFANTLAQTTGVFAPHKKLIDSAAPAMRRIQKGEATDADLQTIEDLTWTLAQSKGSDREILMRSLLMGAKKVAEEGGRRNISGTFAGSAVNLIENMYGAGRRGENVARNIDPSQPLPIGEPITSVQDALKAMDIMARAEIASRVPYDPNAPELPPARVLSDEEKAFVMEAKNRVKSLFKTERELKRIALSTDPMDESTLGIMASGSASSLSLMLPLMMGPQGLLMAGGGYANMEREELLTEFPDMNPDDASKIAILSGAAQAAMDKATLFGLDKFAPNVRKMLINGATKELVKKAALQGTALFAFENTIEAAQDLSTATIQQLVSELSASVPQVDWQKEKEEFLGTRLDVAIGMVPLMLIGAGVNTAANKQQINKMLSNNDLLMRVGIIQEDRVKILELSTAGKTAEAQTALEDAMDRRSPELAAEVADRYASKIDALRNTQEESASLQDATSPEYTAKVSRAPSGWQVTTGDGSVIQVSSAEAARRIAVDLRQVGSQEEADTLVGVIDSYYEQGKQAETVFTGETVMAQEIKAGEGRVFAERRDERNALISQREFGPKALETVREEAAVAGIKSNTRGVFAHINGSNEVFPMRVADGAKEIVRRMNLYKSQAEGQPQVITFLHENFESTWQLGMANGTFSEQETRTAMRALLPAFEGVTALNTEEAQFINNLRTLASGKGNETMLRETVSEMVIRDVLGRDRQGRATGMKPGSISRAIEASVMGANTQEEASALKSILAAIKAFTAYLKGVFGTVDAMIKANEEGKIGAEYDTFINKVLGIDEVKQMESQAVDEVKAMLGIDEEVQAVIDAENMAFSISSPVMLEKISSIEGDETTAGDIGLNESFHASRDAALNPDAFAARNTRQGKGWAGFYTAPTMSETEQYQRQGSNFVYRFDIPEDTKVKILRRSGQIERLTPDQIKEWKSQGFGAVVGKAIFGQKVEVVLLDEAALEKNGQKVDSGTTFSISPTLLSMQPPEGVTVNTTDALPSWTIPKTKGDSPKVLDSPKARAEFYGKLDKAIEWLKADPAKIVSSEGWVTFMKMAGISGEIPLPPSGLTDIINNPAEYVKKLNGGYHGAVALSDTQTSAKQGMDGTVETRNLIGEGKAPAPFVVALHNMWGILSRMLSPIDQEGMWLRLIAHRPVLNAIQSSIDGNFTLTIDQWKQVVQDARAATAIESGKVGNAATSNANDFYLMLSRLNGKWDKMADVYSAANSREMGRRFWDVGVGKLGIKNKVQRFIGLTFGIPGVIMDRWKFVEFWLPDAMEGMGAKKPSDYFKYSKNTPSDPVGIYGVYGGIDGGNETLSLAMYEAFETVLEESIKKSPELQKHLGVHSNAGGMHWFGWNAIKNEAVGHSSLDLTKDLIKTFGAKINADQVYETITNGTYYTEGSPAAGVNVKFILEKGGVRVERTSVAGGSEPRQSGGKPRREGGGAAEGGAGIAGVGQTFSISPAQDAEYLAAAQDPEKNRTLLQKMVDAAAKAAGFTVGPVWHGSNSPFNIFDRKKAKEGRFGKGFYFTPDEASAKNYGNESVRVRGGELTLRQFYLKGDTFNYKDAIRVAFDPSQIKSADPVTYDAEGNVIPLSQRFNEATPDIRFSISPVRNLNELSDQVEKQFAENPVGALEVKSRMIRQFAKISDKWSNERWTPQGNKIRPISEKRTVKSLDKEQAMRQATLEGEKIAANMEPKQALQQAKAEAQAWRDETDAMQKEDWSPKESLVRDLITLEAIIAMFPQEIRGKIGGFVALARKASEAARLKVLQKQLERGQVLLEKHLKEQYGEAVDKLFDKYRPERKAGEKPKGKLDPDAQEISDKAEMAMELSADQVNAEIAAINVLLDADNISAEEEAKLEAMRELVQLLGDWKNADSARRESAFIALNDVLTEGWAKWKLKKIFERERRQELRDALISDIGKPSLAKFRDKQNEWSKSVFGKPFSMLLSISSFSELLTFEFGGTSKTARMLEDKERAAAYAYEDAMQELSDRIGSFFTDMAGGQLKGEQLRFDLAQNNLTIGTGDNERIISQLRGIQALLMWQQEDGRRHMEGPRDENGAPIEGKWSYDQAWIDELISKLSPEALEIKKLLEQLYGEEWVPLNAVYRERNGVNLPRHDKYAPITVTPQQAKAGEMVDPVSGFAINGSILTPGSLRGRNKRAVAEPRFDDAIQIFLGHSRQMEHWKAYYDFATEAQAVLLNRDVMNAVESKGSKQAVTVLKKWIDTFAQGGNRDAQAGLEISNLYSRASGRAARIALFGRVSTIFIQSVQLAAASVKMPLGSYLKRLGMLASGQLDYVDVIKSPFMQRRYKTAPPIVQQAMADVGDVKRPNFFNSTTPRFLGNSLSGADVAFTGGTYAMILDYHRTVTGPALNLKGEELELYAQNEAERDTEAVAQPVRAGTRSIFENTLPTFAKTGFSFASEARQKISLFAWSAYKTKSDPAQAAKVAFLTFIVGGLFTQVIKNLWREAKDDDDEKMWSVERLVKATVAGPLHGVPGVSELTGDSGLFSGFGWSASAVKKITEKAMEDKLDEVTARDIENALSAAGYFNDTAAGVSGASHAVFDFAKVLENIFGED